MKTSDFDKIKTFEQLAKVMDIEKVVSACKQYVYNKAYYKARNAKIREGYKVAKQMGLIK